MVAAPPVATVELPLVSNAMSNLKPVLVILLGVTVIIYPELHEPTKLITTLGVFVKVKLNGTVVAGACEPYPQSICLAVEPPATIAVAFTLPLTSKENVVDGGLFTPTFPL